jgi:RNA polymerase-binding protein DksA
LFWLSFNVGRSKAQPDINVLHIKLQLAMNQNAEKTRYSDEELEEFRVLIQGKLDKARKELDFYLDQLSDMADNPDAKVKGLDDGIGTAENERLTNMASRQRKLIQHLDNALIRIQNKVYGVCRETGKLISKERLRAVPHATLSIDAKKSR